MSMNHAVSELVTSVKNGQLARKEKISTNFSNIKVKILEILKKNGFIKDFAITKDENSFDNIEIELSYFDGVAVIKDISVISKPGKRLYTKVNEIPRVYNGLGMVILSTPKGVLPDFEA